MERLDRLFAEQAARSAAPTSRIINRASTSYVEGGDEDGGGGGPDLSAAAQQILKAHAAGDFFACLSLPRPDCDDAGAPVWAVTEGAIAKAFRKRSLAVHPDKNPSAEAKEAFDKLSDANRALKDPVRRGEALRRFAEEAFREKCRAHPELMAKMKREQERRNADDYGAEIVRQQRVHRERVEAMRRKAAKFRKRHRDDSGAGDDSSSSSSSSDDEDEAVAAKAKAEAAPKACRASASFGSRGSRGIGRGGNRRGNRRGRVGGGDDSDNSRSGSDSDDGGLARPVIGGRGRGKKPRFIM